MEIDGRTFWVRPVSPDVLQSGNVVAAALAESLDKSYPWAVGFLLGTTQLGGLEHQHYPRQSYAS